MELLILLLLGMGGQLLFVVTNSTPAMFRKDKEFRTATMILDNWFPAIQALIGIILLITLWFYGGDEVANYFGLDLVQLSRGAAITIGFSFQYVARKISKITA